MKDKISCNLGEQIQLLKSQLETFKSTAKRFEKTVNLQLLELLPEIIKINAAINKDYNPKDFFKEIDRFKSSLDRYQTYHSIQKTMPNNTQKLCTIPAPPPMPPAQVEHNTYPEVRTLIKKRLPKCVTISNGSMTDQMQSELLKGRQRLKVVQMQRTPSGSPRNKPKPTVVTLNDYLHQELRKKFKSKDLSDQ